MKRTEADVSECGQAAESGNPPRPPVRLRRPLGGFAELDAEGCIKRPDPDLVLAEAWQESVALGRQWYVQRYGPRLHSLYVRGSAATGRPPNHEADLDLIGLLRHNVFRDSYVVWQHVAWEREFAAAHGDLLPGAATPDFVVASLNRGFLERNNALPMILATQAVCIHGTDVTNLLPRYKPGIDTMYYNGRLKLFLSTFYERIEHLGTRPALILECKRVLKALVRCAGELGMERHGRYTRDLYFSCLAFEDVDPKQSGAAWEALELYLEVQPALDRVLEMTASLGHWLAARERPLDLRTRPARVHRLMHDLGLRKRVLLMEGAHGRA
jgi:uncharacterized protein